MLDGETEVLEPTVGLGVWVTVAVCSRRSA
jgi:hypothetical protein